MRNSDMVLAFLAISIRMNKLGIKVLEIIGNDYIKLELPDGEERSMNMTNAWSIITEIIDNDDNPENIA
jgi:hypothetical protein